MPEDASFADLLARLGAGDPDAAARLVDQYARRLAALARARLGRRILRKEDPEDVLQSVFKSFFHRYALGRFHLDSREDLWALLVKLTLHKCGHRIDYYTALRRDVRRDATPAGDGSGAGWEMLAREPPPAEAAMLSETVERLLAGLTEQQQAIVSLSLEGEDVARVAARLNLSQRTVHRVLQGVRNRLLRWQGEAENG